MTTPGWREITRWSYKQPITLFLKRNEWCAVNKLLQSIRSFPRSVPRPRVTTPCCSLVHFDKAADQQGPGELGLVDAHLTSIVYFHSLAVPFGHIAKTVNVSGPL